MTETEAYIAFNLTDRIGNVALSRLEAEYGSAAKAWEMLPGDKRISRSGQDIDIGREIKLAKRYGVEIVTAVDPNYPQILKACARHPLVLYVKGRVSALSERAVAMVGTRKASQYGLDQAYAIGKGLAERQVAVVSGLALGIDAASHQGVLAGKGTAIGVLGSALDKFYPEQNRQLARDIVEAGGAAVSQFPFGRECDTTTFPIRNQVVAALSLGVVAIESPVKSGTLLTCADALDLGRPVMALPGRVDSRFSAGCLDLIADGARMIRNAADICDELGIKVEAEAPAAAAPRPRFSLEESIIMRNVGVEGVSMDKLIGLTRLDAGKVAALCMSLRLQGRLRFLPGNRVALPRED